MTRLRASMDTVTGLCWCEWTKITHGHRLDLENKSGHNIIPHHWIGPPTPPQPRPAPGDPTPRAQFRCCETPLLGLSLFRSSPHSLRKTVFTEERALVENSSERYCCFRLGTKSGHDSSRLKQILNSCI
jgi:hypothetical protein